MKSKVSVTLVAVAVLIILLIVVGLYITGGNVTEDSTGSSITNNSSYFEGIANDAPKETMLYFDYYEGKPVIFFTNQYQQVSYTKEGAEQIKPFNGTLMDLDDNYIKQFDFEKLTNPQEAINLRNTTIEYVHDMDINPVTNKIYVSLNVYGREDFESALVNKVYEIDTNQIRSREIWSNVIGSEKYPGTGGVYFEEIGSDKYLALNLTDCYGCESTNLTKVIILNLYTLEEKYFEGIGSIQFNLQESTFTYKNLKESTVSCTDGPNCEDGWRTVVQPIDPIYKKQLH